MPGTTNTRRTIRRALYDEIPYLGFYGTATSVATTYLADTVAFQDTNLAADQYRGSYIYRPTTTGANIIKKGGTLTNTNGRLAITGPDYTDTTETVYEIIGPLHPDELNACIIRAQQKMYFETQSPLSLAADADMSTSGVSDWTTVGTLGTKEKVTTAANVFSGTTSLHLVNSATDSGARTASFDGEDGNLPVFVSTCVYISSGTATLVLYDATNSAEIKSYSTTARGWTRLWIYHNTPPTCKQFQVRLLGEESNADLYWDHLVVYKMFDQRIFAPAWLNEGHKFLKLREAEYKRTFADHVDDANSRIMKDWYQPNMFSLDPFHPEANAYAIQLQRRLPTADLWIEGKRPYYDLEPLATDTATTTAPLRMAVAYSKVEVANLLVKRYPQDERWLRLAAEANLELKAETQARPEIPQQPIRRNTRGRI